MSTSQEPHGIAAIPTWLAAVAEEESGASPSRHGPVHVTLDPQRVHSGSLSLQQPQAHTLATFEAIVYDGPIPNTSSVDVNPLFLVYTIKKGWIRVLHRHHSSMRTLIKAHDKQTVTDIKFFMEGDVLGTVSSAPEGPGSKIMIWRVYEQDGDIHADPLLEIAHDVLQFQRIVWHPFNPNQLWMIHLNASGTRVATLAETTKIQTRAASLLAADGSSTPYSTCQFSAVNPNLITDGAVTIRLESSATGSLSSLIDLTWGGKENQHVLTIHEHGEICLWDCQNLSAQPYGGGMHGTISQPHLVSKIQHTPGLSSCFFLPHENDVFGQAEAVTNASSTNLTSCFVTASKANSVITLWSSFSMPSNKSSQSVGAPRKIQVVDVQDSSPSYLLAACFGPAPEDPSNSPPPSCFLVQADRKRGQFLVYHIQSEWSTGSSLTGTARAPLCVGVDYVIPFQLQDPILSWTFVCSPVLTNSTDSSQQNAGSGTEDLMLPSDGVDGKNGFLFDMILFAYQPRRLQSLTVTPYMCLPPEHKASSSPVLADSERDGMLVSATLIRDKDSAATPTVSEMDFDEDYDVDEDEDAGEGNNAEQSQNLLETLLTPQKQSSVTSNPFSNWLGAFASQPAPAPDAPVPPSMPPPPPASFLTSGDPSGPPNAPPGLPTVALGVGTEVAPPPPPNPAMWTSGGGDELDATTNASSETPAESTNRSVTSSKAAKKNSTPSSTSTKKKSSGSQPAGKNKGKQAATNPMTPFPEGTKISILKPPPREEPAKSSMSLPPGETTSNTGASFGQKELEETVVKLWSYQWEQQRTQIETLIQKSIESRERIVMKQLQEANELNGKELAKSQKELEVSLSAKIDSTVKTAVVPLASTVGRLEAQGLSVKPDDLRSVVEASIKEPLQVAMAQSLKAVLVPAIESISSQVLHQVQASMQSSIEQQRQHDTHMHHQASQRIQALTEQMGAMNMAMQKMAGELQQMRSLVQQQQQQQAMQAQQARGTPPGPGNGNNAPGPPVVNSVEALKPQVLQLLNQGNFEAAFTKALSLSGKTTVMTVFCCSHSNVQQVLSGGPNGRPVLSQPILLLLMQQLGTALLTSQIPLEVNLELEWLQELALTLQPSDPAIQRHSAGVLQQLAQNVTAKMSSDQTPPQLGRKLQMLLQVIRGIQVG